MFAKIFTTIFDSSIADDWRMRVVFQDLLVLADKDGIVDMTPAAIARRTNIPLEVILEAIPKLEAPDLSSRTPDHEGRRIIRLEAHREWGWRIVNYGKYRESATKEMLRMAEADRKRAYRARFGRPSSPTPPTEIQIQKQRERQNSPGTSPGLSGTSPVTRWPEIAEAPPIAPDSAEWKKLEADVKKLVAEHRLDDLGTDARERLLEVLASQPDIRGTVFAEQVPAQPAPDAKRIGDPVLKTSERISLEQELNRIGAELKQLGTLADHDAGTKRYIRIVELTKRRDELRKILGVVA